MVYAKPPKTAVHNAAGSGDSVMAAIIYGQMKGMTLVEIAQWAVATGAAAVETIGVSEFTVERIKEILPTVESKIINVM
jgi:fructose-1-phosphate kinase PfkB-like protein